MYCEYNQIITIIKSGLTGNLSTSNNVIYGAFTFFEPPDYDANVLYAQVVEEIMV